MITLVGYLESIRYFNQENLYTIARFRDEKSRSAITVVGFLSSARPGEQISICGTWETHSKYGEQFKVETCEVILPSSITAIKKYLKSGIINGIGPVLVDRLVEHFKENCLEIIEKNPDELCAVKGIGKAKAAFISEAWKEHHTVRSLIHFLNRFGINASSAVIILKELGPDSENLISKDPYLIAQIPEIGFNAADALASRLGLPLNMPQRIEGAISHLMKVSVSRGDTFIYRNQLILESKKLLKVDDEIIEQGIIRLLYIKKLVSEKIDNNPETEAISFKIYYDAENFTANKIKALLSVPAIPHHIDQEQITLEVLKKLAVKLSSEQIDVLKGVFSSTISIITGGPGTGKTTLIKAVCAIFENQGKKIILSAPTGRAAKRLSEVTLRKASTIHRMLEYSPINEFFGKNQDSPLDADVLIIDEASMIDTLLMYHLIKAVPVKSVIIIVGDAFQLPSVGPGNVLHDMIKSEIIPVFELTRIFRQAQESTIITNAHLVRCGNEPDFTMLNTEKKLSDFYFIEKEKPQEIIDTIVGLCKKRIYNKYGIDPVEGIQVLTPMHKGLLGTINLNKALQAALNNRKSSAENKVGIFKQGDKVIQLKNNYEKDIFNGETGIISLIESSKKQVQVDYYDKIIDYTFDELNELSLAYAISVHKSQGSEYPVVIMPVTTLHFIMLQRNLLYTAITRGKKLVILTGTKKALRIALKNNKPNKRLSMFCRRLENNASEL